MIAIALLAAFVCPASQKVQADLKEWKKQGASLSALGLKPALCSKPQGVDIWDSHLTTEGDKLVQVRFKCGNTRQLRIGVFVPLAGGGMGRVDGEDLSMDTDGDAKRILDFVELTRPDRRVIQVKDQSDGALQVAFYEVQGWSLKEIFSS